LTHVLTITSHVFLVFALEKQGVLDEAERVCQAATELKPQDPRAWQGLIKLFEKQGAKKLVEYQQVTIRLAQIYQEAEDLYKCSVVVDKYVDFVRANGTPTQYADALWIRLPESPLYPILEGRFPHPAKTYEAVAHILEDFEKKRINTLVGERRTRLGARLDEVKLEVKREVYGQSKLEHIFRQLINWTSDDDVRRQFEEKLLRYSYERLLASASGDEKQEWQQKVLGLANDMVVIRHPYKLAWDIAIDWKDEKEVKSWDVEVLRAYCSFFPDSDMAKIVTAYLTSTLSPFPKEVPKPAEAELSDESEDDEDGGVPTAYVPLTDEERLLMITEGITTADSTLAYRLAGDYFLSVGEYETTVEFMRKGKELLAKERRKSGLPFLNTEDAYSLALGTALVYYQSPRNHQDAKALFDKVLERDSKSTPALIGVGLIFEEEEEYDQAIDFFARALARDGTNIRVRSEAAWAKALKGDWQAAKDELEHCLSLLEEKGRMDKQLLADTQYRYGSCIWNLEPSKEARKRRKGECSYGYWLKALRSDVNHAPSYTSLGVFYGDYAKDKQRSRRCFQKALELSSAEVVAAERLARSFAADGDWDRVELVAQRVVDSGKVKPPPGSKRKGISWPFAALGVAQLNKQDFHKAIVSFQSALRLSPNDYHSWVGLGESYHSSGRFIAATKAMINAQKLEEELGEKIAGDAWFTKYMLANIKRELGDYDDAIELYRNVMETHSAEEGVVLALMQTMIDNALTSVDKGLFGKAIELATETISFASATSPEVRQTFKFWKSVAEACSVFASVQSKVADFPAGEVKAIVEGPGNEGFENLANVDKVSLEVLVSQDPDRADVKANLIRCTHAMILCHKQAIAISAADLDAQAIGYYNLGWAEYRAHVCLGSDSSRKASSPYLRGAVRAFKRAIELEAGNSEFWNALGVVTSEVNPSVAQHAFVRSLHLNERSPVGWVNLGTLALLSGDTKLANDTFTRAQSADPDYAHAWLGQGFVALMYGDAKEARALFTHAMEISEASLLPARRHYSASLFDHILTAPPGLTVASLIQPIFALSQIRGLRPQDLAFSHLSTMFLERTHDSVRSVDYLEEICTAAEADYEETESAESLGRFTLARTDLARAYLAAGSYEKAMECGEIALDLSSDDSGSELTAEQRRQARLSAHLTVGLAKYFANSFDEALTFFESALEESNNNPDATCLLTQVLWAQGSESSREKARSALFEVIESHPSHVQSILLLGVIALLDNDEDSLEAVTEELLGLRTNDKVTDTEQSHVGEVLRAIATLGEGKTQEDLVTQVQNDVMLHPYLPHGWSSLAEVTGDSHAAQMALKVARRGIPPRGVLGCQDLSRAHAGTGSVADAQRAVLLAPWESCGWKSLEAATVSL
jgi:superkiller protein 3